MLDSSFVALKNADVEEVGLAVSGASSKTNMALPNANLT